MPARDRRRHSRTRRVQAALVATLVAAALAPGLAAPPAADASARPPDVRAGAFFDVPVRWATAERITTGVGGGVRFEPHRAVTRGEAVTMLHRMAGTPRPSGGQRFADVRTGAFFDAATRWAAGRRITTGVDGGPRFQPHRAVTRGEAVTMLHRMAGTPRPSGGQRFADVRGGAFFDAATRWAAGRRITTGVDGRRRFEPHRAVTRGEFVTFLWRLAGRPAVAAVPSGWPNAATTGPTAYRDRSLGRHVRASDLRVHQGTLTTTRHGQVIERVRINGSLRIEHDNVVVRAVHVNHPVGSLYGISGSGRNALVEYCEVDGNGDRSTIGIILGEGAVVQRCNVHGFRSGMHARSGRPGAPTSFVDNYVHSLAYGPGTHNVSMAMHGTSHVLVAGNNFTDGNSAAFSIYGDFAPNRYIDVIGNRFAVHWAHYCVFAGYGAKPYAGASHHIRFVGNTFGTTHHPRCGRSGTHHSWDGSKPGNVWRDNAVGR